VLSKAEWLQDGLDIKVDGEESIFDALLEGIDRLGEALASVSDEPTRMTIEAGTPGDDGSMCYLEADLRLNPFNDTDRLLDHLNPDGPQLTWFDVIRWRWVKPSLMESRIMAWLRVLFPDVEFSYTDEAIRFRIEADWENLYDALKESVADYSDSQAGSLSWGKLGINDEECREYELARRFVERTQRLLLELPGIEANESLYLRCSEYDQLPTM